MGCKQAEAKQKSRELRSSAHDKRSCKHVTFDSTSPAPRGFTTFDNNKEPKLVAAWALPDERGSSFDTIRTPYNPISVSIKEISGSRGISQALNMNTLEWSLQRYSRGQKYSSIIAPSYDDTL
ncbi:hypothetical protein LSM04_001629 [Trypanosoma melophagium]|uniref:uncharacterized protein n=1 Tax=Trypanosoma melophagium TaxID=715481 RepID=UPI00351A6204|nr:hypothetical protein LSM04_001629 [Trypanosoma melophagium]